MAKIKDFEDYRALVDEVKVHDYKYFAMNAPTINDEEYDALYFALQEYEEAHPDEVLKDSSTQQCYSENGNGKRTVARRTACLSMKKLHDAKSMLKYLRTQEKAAGLKGARVDIEWKFDGETVSLVYRHGQLAEATYGHGKELMGNDCLEHIKHVQGVPHTVMDFASFNRVEVRGEVIINNENFAHYSKRGKSQRVTSNGIMSKKVAVTAECALLEFHPFRLIIENIQGHHAAMVTLRSCGFLTNGYLDCLDLAQNDEDCIQDIERIVAYAENIRDTLPYPTDGLVFKFDDTSVYDKIGYTDHDAKYNCAFKFRPVFKAVTTYRGHHTTIGEKTGKVTYVADFDEVEMNGHRFAHANCGSERTFLQKGLTPGCKIEVSLHGDVIVCVDGKVEESLVIETEINQSQEQEAEPEPIPQPEPEPAPQPKPKRKRYYPQVGEPTLREEREGTEEASAEDKGLSVKTVLAGVLAVLLAVSMGIVMVAFAGAAVLFMPLMGGLRK